MTSTALAKYTTDKDQKESIESLLRNQLVKDTLENIFDGLLSEEEGVETSKAQYDNPSWAYAQADRNGARRAYRKLRSILIPQSKGKS